MPGAAQRPYGIWGILPSCFLAVGCASSGSDINVQAGPQGGLSAIGGASTATGSTSASNNTTAGGSTNPNSATSNGGNAPANGGTPGTGFGGTSAPTTDGGSTTGTSTNGGANVGGTGASTGNSGNVGGASPNGGNGQGGRTTGGGANRGGSNNAAGGKTSAAGAAHTQAGSVGAGSTCGNETKDEGETDVDCGGTCAPAARCAVDATCSVGRDCASSSCISSVCSAPIVIAKNAGCVSAGATCPSTGSAMQAKVQVLNVGTANLDLKGLEIRYYYTDEAAALGDIVVEVYDKSLSTFDISVVAMTTPTETADHYVRIAYTAGTLIPDMDRVCNRGDNSDCAELTFALHTANYQGTYDPKNDYSFIPSTSLINNGNVTVQKAGKVIWGTAP